MLERVLMSCSTPSTAVRCKGIRLPHARPGQAAVRGDARTERRTASARLLCAGAANRRLHRRNAVGDATDPPAPGALGPIV